MANAPHKFIDWDAIKQAYCYREDKPSYRQLAEEFDVHYSYIGQRASKENWKELRKEFYQEANDKLKDELLGISVSRRIAEVKMIDNILEAAMKNIEENIDKITISDFAKLLKLRMDLAKGLDKKEVADVGTMPINLHKPIDKMTRDELGILRAYLQGKKQEGVEKLVDLETSPDVELIAKYHKQKEKKLTTK